ncbi:zeta toxin family protein, partial [Enterococcus faecalis]|uniref:zeta toxin family protein n=1 Tax=Enterococcus faecalis TaxID=1351 RepID=UPI003CC62A02
MKDSQPIIIGVTGGSGSGKTRVSRAIFNNFPDHSIMMLEQDSYNKDQSHLRFEERLNTNNDHPIAFDTD